jgi:hypothetical protein
MIKKIYWEIQKHPVYLALIVSIISSVIGGLIVNGCRNTLINRGAKPEKAYTKSDFELQEKCAKAAKEFFENEKVGDGAENFSNHYNKKLSKCFISVTNFQSSAESFITSAYLTDVFEHKEIAYFCDINPKENTNMTRSTICIFLNNTCNCNRDQFDAFIKPYMKE